jgi:hypothetical protein
MPKTVQEGPDFSDRSRFSLCPECRTRMVSSQPSDFNRPFGAGVFVDKIPYCKTCASLVTQRFNDRIAANRAEKAREEQKREAEARWRAEVARVAEVARKREEVRRVRESVRALKEREERAARKAAEMAARGRAERAEARRKAAAHRIAEAERRRKEELEYERTRPRNEKELETEYFAHAKLIGILKGKARLFSCLAHWNTGASCRDCPRDCSRCVWCNADRWIVRFRNGYLPADEIPVPHQDEVEQESGADQGEDWSEASKSGEDLAVGRPPEEIEDELRIAVEEDHAHGIPLKEIARKHGIGMTKLHRIIPPPGHHANAAGRRNWSRGQRKAEWARRLKDAQEKTPFEPRPLVRARSRNPHVRRNFR